MDELPDDVFTVICPICERMIMATPVPINPAVVPQIMGLYLWHYISKHWEILEDCRKRV